MNSRELKAQRARCGLTQKKVSELTTMTEAKYCNKENGKEPFTLPEVVEMIPVLQLEHNLKAISVIFFDDGLPIGNSD